jgi:RNA polymerase sigma factor for flagellar operon FliA
MTSALAFADVAPAVAADSGTPDADELARTHMPLVGYLVRELVNRLPGHISRDELVSAGMVALVVSARSFDASRGVPFSRFAAFRIRGALTDELRSMDWASRSVRCRARELHTVRTDLTTTLGRTPSRDEVANAMGVAVSEVDAVDADVQRASVLSLHALTPDTAEDILPTAGDGPEGLLLKREQLGYLHDAIEELPERLRTVVRQYFFEQRTMIHIAAHLGVTESRVSQLRSEALQLLRAGMQSTDAEARQDAADPTSSKRRNAARAAYCDAVSTRSSMRDRLHATTLLGEPTGVAG